MKHHRPLGRKRLTPAATGHQPDSMAQHRKPSTEHPRKSTRRVVAAYLNAALAVAAIDSARCRARLKAARRANAAALQRVDVIARELAGTVRRSTR